jgi:hypothetical protein
LKPLAILTDFTHVRVLGVSQRPLIYAAGL